MSAAAAATPPVSGAVRELPRGGTVVTTRIGPLQFGMPPETIKDSMKLGLPVPQVFVLPRSMFDRTQGINVAEAEFPAYYNFFLHKKLATFVGTRDQEERLQRVFRETVEGPETVDVTKEVCDRFPAALLPDLRAEARHLRSRDDSPQLYRFVAFAEDGIARLADGVAVAVAAAGAADHFAILEDDREVARVPAELRLPGSGIGRELSAGNFRPPQFGVTILGASHGFDPEHRTTGFVLWINGRGVVVDPPLHSRAILESGGVPSRLVEYAVLSHCHADHDSGLFQKILEERQLTVITTNTIFSSFVRKYSAVSRLPEAFLRRLVVFRPPLLGEPLNILGAEFRFFYSIHTIPALGFECFYNGKSVYFSGDTCFDPERIRAMAAAGAMTAARRDFHLRLGGADGQTPGGALCHSLVVHEAGVPPIHTPVAALAALPDDVRQRLLLVHVSPGAVDKASGLRVATPGVEATIDLAAESSATSEQIATLQLIGSIELFRTLPLHAAAEILQVARRVRFAAGTVVVAEGDAGRCFWVVESGVVAVRSSQTAIVRNLISGDFFGETSLITGLPRTATCTAVTEVTAIEFSKADFLALLRGNTELLENIERLARFRLEGSWGVLDRNAIFARATGLQRAHLQALLQPQRVTAGQTLWTRGDPSAVCYVVDSALLDLDDAPAAGAAAAADERRPFARGAFIGEVIADHHSATLRVVRDGGVLRVERDAMMRYLDAFPGLKLAFLDAPFVDALRGDEESGEGHSLGSVTY